MVEQGDRVKLTDAAAKVFMNNKRHKQHRVDWTSRFGTVQRCSMTSDDVCVKWDDRTTFDHWPMRALAKVTA